MQKAVFSYLDFIYEYATSNMLRDYSYVGILQIQNNIRRSVSSHTYGVKGNISKNVYSWRTTFSVTGYYYDKQENPETPTIQSISNYVKLYFYPIKRLELMLGYEHYYNNFIAEGKNKHFADLGISYRWKWADFSLIYTNIINTHQHLTASYSGLDEFVNIYEIRPSQVLLKVNIKIL